MSNSEPAQTTATGRSRVSTRVLAISVCFAAAAVLVAALVAARGEHDPKVRLLIGAIVVLTLAFSGVLLLLVNRLSQASKARLSSELRYREARQSIADNQRRMAHLAHQDPLTGLPSRLHLQSRLPRLLARAARKERSLALMYVDIDHFKNINDSRGHGTGDVLLRVVARRLKHTLASRDLVVRMGGDEFVVIAHDVSDRAGAESLARRINASLAEPIDANEMPLTITASIGISMYPEDGLDPEILLKHADIALYQAKDRGRNNHQMFSADMNVRLLERVALEQALRHAIGTEQLFVEYQPVVDIGQGCIVAMEALARWQHPELGLVPPVRFIPVAEQSGAIVELGEHVLHQVCVQLNEWGREGLPLVPVSINVSPQQFARGRLQETVERITREHGIDPSFLWLEITENAVMHDIEQHMGSLHALRRLGAKIAVDDFGTGYSSLSYLKHLPIDALKVDRSFVRDMATDPNDAAIVTAIVRMARSLGLRTVAEGVETVEQLEQLRSLGCDAAQGYYFGRPMAAARYRNILERLRGEPARADTVQRRVLRMVGG
jgi:diguanylate cyclase (GGDEF)-like protein